MSSSPAATLRVVRVRGGDHGPAAPTSRWNESVVTVRFDEAMAHDAVHAVASGGGPIEGLVLTVSSHWQDIRADFGQQLINTRVAARLLAVRPQALIVEGITGATLDLLRLGPILGIPTYTYVDANPPPPASAARVWYDAALADVTDVLTSPEHENRTLNALAAQAHPMPTRPFDYALYEFVQRDHALLDRMLAPVLPHFAGCRRVLDLACGPGIFVHALQRQGIHARGVERSPMAVRYARAIGLDIAEDDALDYLSRQSGEYDGLLCSHFVEHLPIDVLQHLMALIAQALQPGGVAVFVFPDPESIRSQLLGFWRDPEHVRFYHPDLIALLARGAGLECDFHSHRAQPHAVVSFDHAPPPVPAPVPAPTVSGWRRFLPWQARIDQQAQQIAALEAQVQGLRAAVEKLWQVNQTWAWDDNAIVRVKKPA